MQEGMLYHSLTQGKGLYNVIMNLGIEGYIDVSALDKAFNKVIERHDVLRTKFDYATFKENMQVVYKHRKTKIEIIDISKVNSNKEEYVNSLINQYNENGFDLNKDVLIKLVLVKLDVNKYAIILNHHHILMDGWCIGLIVRELFKIYNGIVTGYEEDLKAPAPYSNYIEWLKGKDIIKAEEYWKDYLAEYNHITKLPFEKENKSNKLLRKKLSLVLDEEKSKLLNEIAADNKITTNTVIQGVWAILLQKYNNSEDIVYGYVVSGRNPEIEGVEGILGLFINTIPLRVKFTEVSSCKDLLININNSTLKHNHYDYLGLAQIQNVSEVKSKLINNILVFENYPIDREELDREISAKSSLNIVNNSSIDETNYDFNIIVSQEENIIIDFKYNEEVFSAEAIEMIKTHFNKIVNEIIKNVNIKLIDLELLEDKEKSKLLLEFNDTAVEYPRHKTIAELFEEQAEESPNNIAIVYGTSKLTYREFNERANSLARILRKKGVSQGVLVGLMVERSIEMLVGIMAILKAGGAYLPIDPENPEDRIKYIIEDSNINLLLSVKDVMQAFSVFIETLDLRSDEIYKLNKENLPREASPSNLAYVIYTSGSTGNPKGVKVKQHSVVNLLNSMQKMYPIRKGKAYLQKTSYVFDVSVSEIFGWFMGGGSLVILKNGDEKDPGAIIQTIKKENISHINFTSSMFNMFLQNLKEVEDITNLDYILTAGEALKINTPLKVKEILEHNIKIENLYGPTEATIYTTCYSLKSPRDYIVIGKPIDNVKTYILDKHNKLVPIGVTGELCIGGEGVALGYINNMELTNEKFIDNPFEAGQKLYKTGDLARWLPDGNIDYLGRIDNQVKIRGFRIELGEIEAKLLEQEDIKYAVVVALEREDNKYLCAYYVSEKDYTVGEFREKLKEALPDYMVPSYFIKIDKIPITTNGKLDTEALPRPNGEINTGVKYEEPANEIEAVMVKICKEVLGLKRLGACDNLSEVGSNSIMAVKICNELRKADINISIKDMFYYGNIRDICLNYSHKEEIIIDAELEEDNVITNLATNEIKQYLIEQIKEFNNSILEQNIVKTYRTSAIQEISRALRLTFSGVILDFDYEVNLKLLRKSILGVINTQGLLRSIIVNSKNNMEIQEYQKLENINIPYLDLKNVDEGKREAVLKHIINEFYEENIQNEKSIFNRLLYKIVIIKLSDKKYKLYMPFNHLIFDGMSNEIIKTNILKAYFNNGNLIEENSLGYYEYVNQLREGPSGITEKEIMKKFNLENFKESFKMYFNKYNATKLVNTNMSIDLTTATIESIRNKHFELSLKIFIRILELNFGIHNIPLVLLNPGRSYGGNNYYNTIGEFIDILPLCIKSYENINLDEVKALLSFADNKNINFISLICDDELKAKYKNISNALENTYTKGLNVPIFNYIELYDLEQEIEELTKVKNVNSTNALSTEINIRFQGNKLTIGLFCEEQRIFAIKEELENLISKFEAMGDR
jgi:amino acid adenylation domain-containing protein